MRIDPSVFESVKAANSDLDLHLLSHDGFEIVVRSPSRAAYKKFRKWASDPSKRDLAIEELVTMSVVAVGGCTSTKEDDVSAAWERMLDRRPALSETFGNKLLSLAGMSDEAEAKKL